MPPDLFESEKLDKLDRLVNDQINGNLKDFRKGVKSLTKIQTLDLIERFSACGIQRHIVINKLRNILS